MEVLVRNYVGPLTGNGGFFLVYEIENTIETALVSGVVTLPAQVGTNWNVSLEKSTDLANWSPVAPGTFLGKSDLQFFRVRMEKTP